MFIIYNVKIISTYVRIKFRLLYIFHYYFGKSMKPYYIKKIYSLSETST